MDIRAQVCGTRWECSHARQHKPYSSTWWHYPASLIFLFLQTSLSKKIVSGWCMSVSISTSSSVHTLWCIHILPLSWLALTEPWSFGLRVRLHSLNALIWPTPEFIRLIELAESGARWVEHQSIRYGFSKLAEMSECPDSVFQDESSQIWDWSDGVATMSCNQANWDARKPVILQHALHDQVFIR